VQVSAYDSDVVAAERRQPRGERRRSAILAAALRVIAERGVAATTHRAVAEAAGVPTSTTTYYFESLDELLDEALLLFVREEAERLRGAHELGGRRVPAGEVARVLVAELRAGQGPNEVAQFELYLEASRRPSLREAARASIDLYTGVAEAALRAAGSARPAEGARAFVALLDGLGLHRIASGSDQDLERVLLTLFIPFAMDDAELGAWRKRLSG
jgi:TetR/AcrR family transcriptional regulator, regulator of biofilm formation and stress response